MNEIPTPLPQKMREYCRTRLTHLAKTKHPNTASPKRRPKTHRHPTSNKVLSYNSKSPPSGLSACAAPHPHLPSCSPHCPSCPSAAAAAAPTCPPWPLQPCRAPVDEISHTKMVLAGCCEWDMDQPQQLAAPPHAGPRLMVTTMAPRLVCAPRPRL